MKRRMFFLVSSYNGFETADLRHIKTILWQSVSYVFIYSSRRLVLFLFRRLTSSFYIYSERKAGKFELFNDFFLLKAFASVTLFLNLCSMCLGHLCDCSSTIRNLPPSTK